jgi:Secreted repeat of unknown function
MKVSIISLTVAAALSLAGLSSALAAGDSASRAATVSTAKTNLGNVIVNGSGRTLYLFEKDKRGKSACSGACATYWPPLITHGKPMTPALLRVDRASSSRIRPLRRAARAGATAQAQASARARAARRLSEGSGAGRTRRRARRRAALRPG